MRPTSDSHESDKDPGFKKCHRSKSLPARSNDKLIVLLQNSFDEDKTEMDHLVLDSILKAADAEDSDTYSNTQSIEDEENECETTKEGDDIENRGNDDPRTVNGEHERTEFVDDEFYDNSEVVVETHRKDSSDISVKCTIHNENPEFENNEDKSYGRAHVVGKIPTSNSYSSLNDSHEHGDNYHVDMNGESKPNNDLERDQKHEPEWYAFSEKLENVGQTQNRSANTDINDTSDTYRRSSKNDVTYDGFGNNREHGHSTISGSRIENTIAIPVESTTEESEEEEIESQIKVVGSSADSHAELDIDSSDNDVSYDKGGFEKDYTDGELEFKQLNDPGGHVSTAEYTTVKRSAASLKPGLDSIAEASHESFRTMSRTPGRDTKSTIDKKKQTKPQKKAFQRKPEETTSSDSERRHHTRSPSKRRKMIRRKYDMAPLPPKTKPAPLPVLETTFLLPRAKTDLSSRSSRSTSSEDTVESFKNFQVKTIENRYRKPDNIIWNKLEIRRDSNFAINNYADRYGDGHEVVVNGGNGKTLYENGFRVPLRDAIKRVKSAKTVPEYRDVPDRTPRPDRVCRIYIDLQQDRRLAGPMEYRKLDLTATSTKARVYREAVETGIKAKPIRYSARKKLVINEVDINDVQAQTCSRQDGTSKAHSRDDKDDDSNPSGDNINHDAPTTLKLPPWLLSRQRLAVGNAAISVYLSQSKQHMTNEAIKFDRILLNDGNVYNTFTGAFTAPLSGIYLFTYHFDSTTSTFVRLVRLVVNGVNEVDAVANPHVVSGPRQAQSMGGNTCIIHVSHGQAVQIQVYEIPDTTID
ncbi:hypothetical protein MAR_023565, partial [Mya arenaria]